MDSVTGPVYVSLIMAGKKNLDEIWSHPDTHNIISSVYDFYFQKLFFSFAGGFISTIFDNSH